MFNFVAGGIHVAQTAPLHLHSLPVTFGLSAFVYSGHAVFPSIYRSMKDRSQYPKMLDTTYFIVGVTGALIGTVLTALSFFCLQIAWALFKHRLTACPGWICILRKPFQITGPVVVHGEDICVLTHLLHATDYLLEFSHLVTCKQPALLLCYRQSRTSFCMCSRAGLQCCRHCTSCMSNCPIHVDMHAMFLIISWNSVCIYRPWAVPDALSMLTQYSMFTHWEMASVGIGTKADQLHLNLLQV